MAVSACVFRAVFCIEVGCVGVCVCRCLCRCVSVGVSTGGACFV